MRARLLGRYALREDQIFSVANAKRLPLSNTKKVTLKLPFLSHA
jgi:hypothetical protein